MTQFQKRFLGWFLVLLAFFLLANLAGLVRPMGVKPFRSVGFPLPFAVWGYLIEEPFGWSELAADAAVAVVVSGLVSWLCAWAWCRSEANKAKSVTEPLSWPPT